MSGSVEKLAFLFAFHYTVTIRIPDVLFFERQRLNEQKSNITSDNYFLGITLLTQHERFGTIFYEKFSKVARKNLNLTKTKFFGHIS
jgi:hypothetical protein